MGILYFVCMQLFGLTIAYSAFGEKRAAVRLWLGSCIGSMLSAWLSVPFAFLLGFTRPAHYCALLLGFVIAAGFFLFRKKLSCAKADIEDSRGDLPLCFLLPPFMLLCIAILCSHTLSGGGLYTGQCCYGDMAMHLGFITSIAEQGFFPPEYSILPGSKLCYPFLCDSISSSLYLFGLELRWAYMLPMFFALMQVFCGAWFLFHEICRRRGAAVLAFILFFLCGGFGTVYFFGEYTFTDLFTGFYKTPTNLTEMGIRWVNVIADMLIPQRATLFGWAGLFACLYLLFRAVFKGDTRLYLPAGILGGLLPMLHTHSYLGLGLVAFAWLVLSCIREGLSLKWFKRWCLFGIPAVLIALPQVLEWTLQSAGGNDQFLRIHLLWLAQGTNPLWFWLMNVGLPAVVIPLAYIFCDRRYKEICAGSVLIFLLCNIFVFQPNVYDNNKLLYVSYLFFCALSADALLFICGKIAEKSKALSVISLVLIIIICTNAAVLTLAREVVSGLDGFAYRLFSSDELEAVEYIKSETDADALFLTGTQHNNAVAALSGRNIVCGSSSYLYYHGLDYRESEQLAKAMLTDAEVFEQNVREMGIDYVYIGPNERYMSGSIYPYLCDNYEKVFTSGIVDIFAVK